VSAGVSARGRPAVAFGLKISGFLGGEYRSISIIHPYLYANFACFDGLPLVAMHWHGRVAALAQIVAVKALACLYLFKSIGQMGLLVAARNR